MCYLNKEFINCFVIKGSFCFQTNMISWIKDRGVQYDAKKNVFFYDKVVSEVTLQSPTPLTKGRLDSCSKKKYSSILVCIGL